MIEFGFEAQEIIKRHESKVRREAGPIFRNNFGNGWQSKVICDRVKEACQKAGVPRWAPTDLLRMRKMHQPQN